MKKRLPPFEKRRFYYLLQRCIYFGYLDVLLLPLPHNLFLLPKKRPQRFVYLAFFPDHAMHELRVLDVPISGHQSGVPVVLVDISMIYTN